MRQGLFRNKLLACCHVVVFVSLWKVSARGGAYYELWEPMGSGGKASSRENPKALLLITSSNILFVVVFITHRCGSVIITGTPQSHTSSCLTCHQWNSRERVNFWFHTGHEKRSHRSLLQPSDLSLLLLYIQLLLTSSFAAITITTATRGRCLATSSPIRPCFWWGQAGSYSRHDCYVFFVKMLFQRSTLSSFIDNTYINPQIDHSSFFLLIKRYQNA